VTRMGQSDWLACVASWRPTGCHAVSIDRESDLTSQSDTVVPIVFGHKPINNIK